MSKIPVASYDREFKKKLGLRVRYLRATKLNASQEQLGHAADTSISTISRIELGTTEVVVSKMKQIADALGVEMFDLMDVEANRLKEVSDTDVDLSRLYAQVAHLDENQKKVIAGTIRGTLQGFRETTQTITTDETDKQHVEADTSLASVKPSSKQTRKNFPSRA